MTTLGVLVAATGLLLYLRDRRSWLLNLLGVCSGLPIGVVLVGGGQALPAVYAVALVICAGQVLGFVTRPHGPLAPPLEPELVRGPKPGLALLVFFTVWGCVITIVGPTLFAGMPVLSPRGGLDEQLIDPVPLAYSVSDVAQLSYTLLGIAIIWFVGRSRQVGPGYPGIGLAVSTLLSSWRLLSFYSPVPFPAGLFDNSPTVRIIDTTETGEPRFRGIYSEPSSMGAAAVTAAVFFLVYQRRLTGWRRWAAIALALLALLNGALSASATFVTTGALQLGLALLAVLGGFFFRRSLVRPFVFALSLVAGTVAVVLVPRAVGLLNAVVSDKLGSSSYTSRSGADLFSIRLMLDTWGLGAGLGSNRPSSLVPSALSRVGVPGTIAFFGLIVTVIRVGWGKPAYRATVWVFACSVLGRLVSGPGLLEPFMSICIGVLVSTVWFVPPQGSEQTGRSVGVPVTAGP